MSALARFVADMLAEEERLAQAATAGAATAVRWRRQADHLYAVEIVAPPPDKPGVHAKTPRDWWIGEVHDQHVVDHIAHHDPVRALALVAAGRAILAVHRAPTLAAVAFSEACTGCGWNDIGQPCTIRRDDCPTLRAFALTWAGHERYDEEWRPNE